MDGTYFAPRVEKNIAIDCEVCSPKDLRQGDDGTDAISKPTARRCIHPCSPVTS